MCLSIQELVSLTGCKVFAMLRAYIDDSWDGDRQIAVTAGCYIGRYSDWTKLRDRWKKRLRRGGIEFFHSTEFYSLRGEFEKFRDPVKYPKPSGRDAADDIRRDLFSIISSTQIAGMAVSIPIDAYCDVRANEPHADKILPPKDHAFKVVIQELFGFCAEEIEKRSPHEKVAFVCDQSDEYPAIADIFLRYKELNPFYAKYLETIVPLDDKKYPQLQAADIMAHLAKERYTEWLLDQRPESSKPDLESRLKELRVQGFAHVSRERLRGMVQHEAARRGLI